MNNEVFSDHPLFRALVLMGGGLALSCGGVARTDPNPGSSSGAGSSGSAGAPTGPLIIDPPPATSTGAGGYIQADPPPNPPAAGGGVNFPCPSEQLNCGALSANSTCSFDLSTAEAAASCVCEFSRPTSAKQCNANENFVCLQAYDGGGMIVPQTWDYSIHVQCACIPSVTPPVSDDCSKVCTQAYPDRNAGGLSCILPSPCTYDDLGNCTATSADVLRQDGIMCGCANIGLI